MTKLLILLLTLCQISYGVTPNKVWRVPPAGTLGAWGPIILSDPTNAVTDGGIQQIYNAAITASVGSSALTIALKQADASTNASSVNPISIPFRSSTLTSGVFSVRTVTGALSVVVSSGSTLGVASNTLAYAYVYALDNAGTVELAIGTSPVDESILQSTTAEGGAGAADSNTVLYSTTARSGVAVRLIGVIQYTETTAGTWATAPSVVANFTAAHPISQMRNRQSSTSAGIGGLACSAGSGSFSTTATSLTDVTNLSVTLVTTGRPILTFLQGTGTASGCGVDNTTASHTSNHAIFFLTGAGNIGSILRSDVPSTSSTTSIYGNCPSGGITTQAAGTYTIKMQAECQGSTTCSHAYVTDVVLCATEL